MWPTFSKMITEKLSANFMKAFYLRNYCAGQKTVLSWCSGHCIMIYRKIASKKSSMKKTIFLLCFLSLTVSAYSQNPDEEAIKQVVAAELHGLLDGDAVALKNAWHIRPYSALLVSSTAPENTWSLRLEGEQLPAWLEERRRWKAPPSPNPITSSGSAAKWPWLSSTSKSNGREWAYFPPKSSNYWKRWTASGRLR